MTPSRLKPSRLPELDALRGIASVSVMIHHNLAGANLLTGRLRDILVASPLRVLNDGRAAVMLFFVLSGLVLTRSLVGRNLDMPGMVHWVVQRTLRLMLPACAAVVLSGILYMLIRPVPWPGEAVWLDRTTWMMPPSWSVLLSEGSLLSPSGTYGFDNVLWSLSVEWRLSVVLPLVAVPLLFAGRRGAAALLFFGVALACLVGDTSGRAVYAGDGVVEAVRSCAYFALPFALGCAIERAGLTVVRAEPLVSVAAVLAVAGLLRSGGDFALYAASALGIWVVLQEGWLRRVMRGGWLVWLGTVSFSLYLVHVPILAALHHGLHDVMPTVAIFVISVVASVPAAWLMYVAVERPTHRLARTVGPWSRRKLSV